MVDEQHAQNGAVTMPVPDEVGPIAPAPAEASEAATGATEGVVPGDAGAVSGGPGDQVGRAADVTSGATASQLRRFIKSRPWIPMHELRRRFGIEGTDDEMSPVDLKDGRIFVGLPPREAALLGDLIRQGEIGFELVHDPDCPAVAGVYPMRPVVRQ